MHTPPRTHAVASRGPIRRRRRGLRRRGFNLVEMLIALAISSALLTATMVALDASFTAYQQTTEQASTHTIARLAMHRMLTLIRTGSEFGPQPVNPLDEIVESEMIEFLTTTGDIMVLEWIPVDNRLEIAIVDPDTLVETTRQTLLEGVVPQFDENGDQVMPFTLEFELGNKLRRATINLSIEADDDVSLDLEGNNVQPIRLVGSAMPRTGSF